MAGTQVVQGSVHGGARSTRAERWTTLLSSFGVEFVVARNPDPQSSLPFLVHIPLGAEGIALKVRDVWPRTTKLYCHRADGWPDDPDVIERIPVRSCARRGAAIDLVLDRGRENRSQFVFTKARGREVIFWQSARTAKQARPNVTLPTARAPGGPLEIIVDAHERYAWNFSHQQATTVRRALPAGDYAVADDDGEIVAAVERKSFADFVATVTNGKLRFAMAALASMPRAAVVVEDRYSAIFKLDTCPAACCGRRPGRAPGALSVGADRVRRDAATRPGVDVPLPRRRPRASPPRPRRGTARRRAQPPRGTDSSVIPSPCKGPVQPAAANCLREQATDVTYQADRAALLHY